VGQPAVIGRARAWLDGEGRRWLKRGIVGILAIAALVALAYLGAAFLPRWWAHRVAHQVNGGMTTGIMLGLFYGLAFTFIPLFIALRFFRRRRSWKPAAAVAALVIVLAGPNLLTLGIVIGSGHSAHAGQRTLDVDAPGFRGATLAGAIVGLLAVAGIEYLLVSRRIHRRKLREAQRPG
jgi:MFS family permease